MEKGEEIEWREEGDFFSVPVPRLQIGQRSKVSFGIG